MAIDTPHPRLSWKLDASRPAQMMTAYQVLVATQPDLLEPGRSNVWDSGRVQGDDFTGVLFQGNRLESGRRYLWKVRCWDVDGIVGAWSEVESWRMGLLTPDDWPKEWLGAPDVGRAPQQVQLGPEFHPVWQYRREFRIKTQPTNATLYLAAVGIADVWVNGRIAGDAVLDPALTEFRKRVPYVARDLTSSLKAGDNCLGIRLGNGFANPIQDVRAFPRLAPRFQAVLRIEYPDGSVETVSSGEWRASLSEVTYNCFFGGESLDARLRNPRWSNAGRGGVFDEGLFLLVATAFGEDFAAAEEVEHGVLADRTGLPGGDEGGDLGGGQAGGAEVGVEFKGDVVGGDVVGKGLG